MLLGTITAVVQVNLTLWRNTMQVADEEMAATPTAAEMQLFLSCVGAESNALLKKMAVLQAGAPILTMAVWSPDSSFALQDTVVVGPRWLGTVPHKFLPEGGMRISVNQNAGMSGSPAAPRRPPPHPDSENRHSGPDLDIYPGTQPGSGFQPIPKIIPFFNSILGTSFAPKRMVHFEVTAGGAFG